MNTSQSLHEHGREPGPGRAFVADDSRVGVLAAMWRFRWLCALTTVLIMGSVVGLSLLVAGKPSGSIKLALSNATENNLLVPGTIGDSAVARYVNQRSDFLTSDELLLEVQGAGVDTSIEDLKDQIAVNTTTGSNVLEISVSGDDAGEVTTLAQALVDVYREMTEAEVQARSQASLATLDADIKAAVSQLQRRSAAADVAAQSLVELRAQAATIRIDAANFGDGVDWASIPSDDEVDTPVPSPRDAAVGFVLGLMAAAFLAWVMADSRRVVRTQAQAGQVLGAPVLGKLSRKRHRRMQPVPVLASMALASRTPPGVVVVLTDSSRGRAGQSAKVLAAGLAVQGRSVVVVDQNSGDDRNMHRSSDSAVADKGLRETEGNGLRPSTLHASSRVWSLGAGPEEVRSAFNELRTSYEWVVVDAGTWDDSAVLAFVVTQADAVVAAVSFGSREQDVARIATALDALNVGLTGIIYIGD